MYREGTTTEQFAMFLPRQEDRIVITASLQIASLLASRRERVTVLGGSVLADELVCVGAVAAATVRRYHAEVAVLGAAGLSAGAGITELDDEVAEIHRLMIERSDRLLIVADGSKLGTHTRATVTRAAAIDLLITDASAAADEVDALGSLGAEVVAVGPGAAQTNGEPMRSGYKEADPCQI